MTNYLDELNPAQRDAAEHTEGPLMILAGAGAGKTKTITYRIAHLIEEGTPADAILAVTFTNKAAREMRERVVTLLAKLPGALTGRPPFVSTFHALGVRILRENATLLGITRSFTIWDRADSIRAIKAALTDLGLEKQYEAKHILGRISKEKGDAVTYTRFANRTHTPWEEACARVWALYQQALAREHALDFDDLLLSTLTLLSEHTEVRERYRARWTHILIDEYQDTNGVQYEIMRQLVGEENNICVVGDIDQNIYSWRGADIAHLLTFEKTFPNTKTVLLEQNYRSTKTILETANTIIAKNKNRFEKKLFTEGADGDPIVVYQAIGEGDEARFVAAAAASHVAKGTPPEEIAVLYRSNAQSRALEEAFLNSGIPYRVLGVRFFERKEVKDVLSYLRLALNPESRADLARIIGVPTRGIGKQTLAAMLEGTEDTLSPAARAKVDAFRALMERIRASAVSKPLPETLALLMRESGLERMLQGMGEEAQERLENIRELVNLSTRYSELSPQESAEKLIEEAALASEQDSLEQGKAGGVSLMTVHAAKGLEFDVVFVTGLEAGLFPHEKFDDNVDEEEERRLFYVAVTRARKQLYLTHAATRLVYGNREITSPSEFLDDIADDMRIDLTAEEITRQETPRPRRGLLDDWDEPTIH